MTRFKWFRYSSSRSGLRNTAAAHHRLPRARLLVRLPEEEHAHAEAAVQHGPVHRHRPQSPAHAHRRNPRQAGHRSPGPQVEEHLGQERSG
jgi:hypothetical protein